MSRLYLAMTVVLAAGLSMQASAGCSHNHRPYPEGGITCTAHRQFQCGAMGAWHPVPGRCDADPAQPTKPAADQPPGNGSKEKGGPSRPAGNR